MSAILEISGNTPQPELIDAASATIQAGGVVVFPTHGLYGLAADALNSDAVDRIYKIKQRSPDNPLPVLVAERDSLAWMVRNIPPAALRIMDQFWPGGVTLVFDAAVELPHNLTAGTGKIAIRLPGHPVAAAIVRAVDGPVTATSANLSGQAGCADISHLDPVISDRTDLVLDAGPLAGGPGSTIVDVTTDPPTVLREGAVAAHDILACIG